ncbi:MAG: Sodium/pantothenate symporter [Planctomycetes bacterium ADurb.Bin401]|nr:MAG: Sodium/pantothenate symporter [Planctomycetes bacterium ADurb.Bin401]
MFGLEIADIVVIILYFSLIIAIGFWASRRIKSKEDYFLAGRSFGKLVQTFAAFGQATSADTAVGVTTTTFNNGIAGIWSSMLYLFATPLYWVVTHWPRRMRVFTLGDYFIERYNSVRMGLTYSLIGAVGMMAFIAVGFNAMAKTIEAIMPKEIKAYSPLDIAEYSKAYEAELATAGKLDVKTNVLSYEELAERDRLERSGAESLREDEKTKLTYLNSLRPAKTISYISKDVLVWVVCAVVLLYAVVGGVLAAFIIDMIQGMFIILLSVMLLPFAWAKINKTYGGSGLIDALATIHHKLPDAFFQIFGAPQTPDFTWYYIITLSFMAAITVVVQPTGAVLAGSAKDEFSNRSGVVIGNFIKRFCTVMWALLGLAAIVLYSGKVVHSDLIWGHAALDLLGSLHIGLMGLMIACLLAALLSTVDCHMLTSSSLLMHNFYTPLVPNRSQKHYIWAGRTFGALIVLSSAWVALQFDTILQILKFIWEINVMLAPAYWLGIKWRRANRYGAWASISIGALLFLIIPVAAPTIWPQMRNSKELLKTTNPAPIVKIERASEYDVQKRQQQIEQWERLSSPPGSRPVELTVGSEFEQTYTFPKKSIFWSQGIKADADGKLSGKGMFSTELWIIEKFGANLDNKPYALNETLRILFRTLLPFAIMIAVSLATKKDPENVLNRFYAKMRTKVIPDHDIDAREVTLSLQNPNRYDHLLVFPKSEFEIYRWTRQDFVGFALSVIGVGMVIVFIWLMISIGA